MTAIVETAVMYPIKDIWTSIAESHSIPLQQFTEKELIPGADLSAFPHLTILAANLITPYKISMEVAGRKFTAFEGSNDRVSLAYFSREVKEYDNFTKENALVFIGGRRIRALLNENGMGEIIIDDRLVREARKCLGEDCYGRNFDEQTQWKYGFKERDEEPGLPGIKAFMGHLFKN